MTMNLIPTPRMDKNGRTVIRHMKPDQVKENVVSLPPVQPNVHPASTPGLTNDQIRHIISHSGGMSAGVFMDDELLDGIRLYTGEAFDRSVNYLDSSGTHARELAISAFAKSVHNFSGAFSSEFESVASGAHTYLDMMEANVVMGWSVGSVIDEIGYEKDRNSLVSSAIYFESVWNSNRNNKPRSVDPDMCRNVAALSIAFSSYDITYVEEDALKALEWVGEREDLAEIMQVASERKTLDTGILSAVLEQGIKTALREGAL